MFGAVRAAEEKKMVMMEMMHAKNASAPKGRQYNGVSTYGNSDDSSSSGQSSSYNAGNINNNNYNNGNNGGNRAQPSSSACNEILGSPIVAKCTITTPRNSTVSGTLTLTQNDAESPVSVQGTLMGLLPAGNHGIHVHQSGDFSNGCTSAGEHYNPQNTTHGAPTNPPTKRHDGDLGNIAAGANGVAVVAVVLDDIFSLFGLLGVIGRSIVVHAMPDDLGLGTSNVSLTTGNSGARLGCCVIGYSVAPQ